MFVFNYTGDRLNFGLAVEKAKMNGVNVEMFVNGEDTANTGAKKAGRRGMAGNMFLLKVSIFEFFHFLFMSNLFIC